MRLHVVTHVAFEGPVGIAAWAESRGHQLTESLALTEEFPQPEAVDLLVVMGGPMAADDERANPWLVAEKAYIARAAEAGVPVLGICLGAQLLAEVAGGRVRRNLEPEIGWFPVCHTETTADEALFADFPDGLVVGHWHGDTFDLPSPTRALLSSEACANQAFSLEGGRFVGLQFHLEWSPASLDDLIEACGDELSRSGTYVSDTAELRRGALLHHDTCRAALDALLDRMTSGRSAQEG